MEFRKRKNSGPTQPTAPLNTQPEATPHIYSLCCPLLPYLINGPFQHHLLLISCTVAPFTLTNAYSSPATLHSNCSGCFQQTYYLLLYLTAGANLAISQHQYHHPPPEMNEPQHPFSPAQKPSS
jgi:hypothetical protein